MILSRLILSLKLKLQSDILEMRTSPSSWSLAIDHRQFYNNLAPNQVKETLTIWLRISLPFFSRCRDCKTFWLNKNYTNKSACRLSMSVLLKFENFKRTTLNPAGQSSETLHVPVIFPPFRRLQSRTPGSLHPCQSAETRIQIASLHQED